MLGKRFLTTFVAAVMAFSLVPASALAVDGAGDSDNLGNSRDANIAYITDTSGEYYTGSAWSSVSGDTRYFSSIDDALDQAVALSNTYYRDIRVNVVPSSLSTPIFSNRTSISAANSHKITLVLTNKTLSTTSTAINVPKNLSLSIVGGRIVAPTGITAEGDLSLENVSIEAQQAGVEVTNAHLTAVSSSISTKSSDGCAISISNAPSASIVSNCNLVSQTCLFSSGSYVTVSGPSTSFAATDIAIYSSSASTLNISSDVSSISSTNIGIYLLQGNLTMLGANLNGNIAIKATRPVSMYISGSPKINGAINCNDLVGFLYGGLYSQRPLDKYVATGFEVEASGDYSYPWRIIEDDGIREDTVIDSATSTVGTAAFLDKDEASVANSFVSSISRYGGFAVSNPDGFPDVIKSSLTMIASRNSSTYTQEAAIAKLNNPTYNNSSLVTIHYEPKFVVNVEDVEGRTVSGVYVPQSVTLNITPHYDVAIYYNGSKTSAYFEQNQSLEVSGYCDVSIALPEGFALSASDTLYVDHYGKILNSSVAYGDIYLSNIEFTTDGFSPFVLTKNPPEVCIGNVNYSNLQAALNDVKDGQTVTLKANISSGYSASVDGSKIASFIVNTNSFIGFDPDKTITNTNDDYVLNVIHSDGSNIYRFESIPKTQASFTLTFETGDNSTPIDSVVERYGTKVDLSQYTPMRIDYTFDGWYADPNLTIHITEVEIVSDTTVYAKWSPILSKRYSDVFESDWFYNDVYRATSCEYVHGVGDSDIFAPNSNICRADALVILFNMAGGTGETSSRFKLINEMYAAARFDDVEATDYFAEAVGWGARVGITTGVDGKDIFKPLNSITREEMAAFIQRYAQVMERYSASEDPDAILAKFPDGAAVSSWAIEPVAWCAENYIMGKGGTLNPVNNITRAEVAAMAVRFQPSALTQD